MSQKVEPDGFFEGIPENGSSRNKSFFKIPNLRGSSRSILREEAVKIFQTELWEHPTATFLFAKLNFEDKAVESKFRKASHLTVYRRCKALYRLTVLFDILLISSSVAFLSFHKGNKLLIVGPLVAGILVKLGAIVLVYFKLEQIMVTMLTVTIFSALSYFVFFFELKASADVATVNTTLAQDEWKIQGLVVSTGWLTNAVVLSALATITRNRYHTIIVMLVMDASYGALYALEDACSAPANCIVLSTLMVIFTVYSFTVSYSSFLYEVEIRKDFQIELIAKKSAMRGRELEASYQKAKSNANQLHQEATRLKQDKDQLLERLGTDALKFKSPIDAIIETLSSLQKDQDQKGNHALASDLDSIKVYLQRTPLSRLTRVDLKAVHDSSAISLDTESEAWLDKACCDWDDKRVSLRKQRKLSNNTAHLWIQRKTSLDSDLAKYELGDWNKFDVFKFCTELDSPLPAIINGYANKFGLYDRLGLQSDICMSFFDKLAATYCYDDPPENTKPEMRNPYHNSMHAVDVVHATAYFLDKGKLFSMVGSMDRFALLFAAAIHDYRHPGRTNSFLIDVQNPISIAHNDQSPLERFHLAEAFKLLYTEKYNFLEVLTRAQQVELRHMVVDLVLATDLASTSRYLSAFKELIARKSRRTPKRARRKSSIQVAANLIMGKFPDTPSLSLSAEDSILLLKVSIKVADICHPAKPWDIHLQWTKRVQEEFFSQGDEQQALGLAVEPLCCRTDFRQAKSQIGFIEYVCNPIIVPYCGLMELPELTKSLQDNLEKWKEQARVE